MVMATIGLTVINAVLLLVLSAVWVRNYRTFKSTLTLGLLAFGVVLLVENLAAIYFYFNMVNFYAANPLAGQTALVTRGLQFVALGFLAYVTMQ
jgi:hypothetical protein